MALERWEVRGGNAAAVVTTAMPFTIGASGLTATPTFTGYLEVGQRWVVWLLPTRLRLDLVSDNFESLTMKMYFDGMSHTLTGAFGTFQITAEAGNYARVEFDFTGQYYDPGNEALPNPTTSAPCRPRSSSRACASTSSTQWSPRSTTTRTTTSRCART